MKDLIDTLGERLLRYILAIPDPDNLEEEALSQRQREVLSTLQQVLSAMLQGINDSFARFSALSQLFAYHQGMGHSVANGLRLMAGGTLPEVGSTDDPVNERLRTIVVECYPAFLVRSPETAPATFWTSSPLAAIQHPGNVQFIKELLRDEALTKLFPNTPRPEALSDSWSDLTQIHSEWMFNTGRGGTAQAISLAGSFANSAYYRVVARGEEPDPASYLAAVSDVLRDVRHLANGREAPVPRLVGLYNIELDEGVQVTLQGGRRLRQTSALERENLLPEGGNTKVVLESTYPLRLLSARPWRVGEDSLPWPSDHLRAMEAARRETQRISDHARFALSLAGEPNQLVGAVEMSNIILDPMMPGGVVSWGARPMSPVPPATISAGMADEASRWSDVIQRHSVPNLDIGIRRLLAAVTSRLDPIDGFVDAVICWENMFGTRTETTFRVVGAMAWLLEPEQFERRRKLQSELKQLYDTRSYLVHGSSEPNARTAIVHRDRSALLAVECMRRLYRQPDLLSLKSEDRSTRLMLGALRNSELDRQSANGGEETAY